MEKKPSIFCYIISYFESGTSSISFHVSFRKINVEHLNEVLEGDPTAAQAESTLSMLNCLGYTKNLCGIHNLKFVKSFVLTF